MNSIITFRQRTNQLEYGVRMSDGKDEQMQKETKNSTHNIIKGHCILLAAGFFFAVVVFCT